jgi:hypothetical protein
MKKPKKELLSEYVRVPLTKSQKIALAYQADIDGDKLGTYARKAIVAHMKGKKVTK